MTKTDLWINVLKTIQPSIPKAPFITWFQNTDIILSEGAKIVIGVPTQFTKDWLVNRYNGYIADALKELAPEVTVVEYEVSSRLLQKDGGGIDVNTLFLDDNKKVRKVRKLNEVRLVRGERHRGEVIVSKMFNDKYKLDNFVVGRDNRLPHAAAMAVSGQPGGIYNPLYIYGDVGLGKTHLLQGIGNSILAQHSDLVIKYITAEKFVNEVVQAIGKKTMNQFKDQYRNVDVFLVDDIQFFARKNSSQQEFFHTFNELYEQNKQIVLTSDRPPSELDDLDDRLKSRFGMGMVVELLFPDYETRLAILQNKCQDFNILIDPEVLSFIANNVHNNVRELEGVLRQAVAESQLSNRVPTIRSVAEIIQRMNKAQAIIGYDIVEKGKMHMAKTCDDVMKLVADFYGVTMEDLVGKNRQREYLMPRQICMYLIKNELGQSYEKIGNSFGGRKHTTVINACTKTERLLRNDLRLVRDINAIKRDMGL
ncbi:chromosomal replication initiator protein DnaA [Candidatus Peregrinibacteria bacterium HGW-Peregrinibacteria-1]|jgi:chromosomal replication initiator protein|nr:MAG: chromosomal replication initiator protein DnaA [Candidatus Peregrinibacteria bacterium HGW-Peregrinibacteria-1]